MTEALKAGDRVVLVASHPWGTHAGTLVAYESYGPAMFGWKGWRMRLDDCCEQECYAKPSELRKTR